LNSLALFFTGKSLYLQDKKYSIGIYRPYIYREIPVNSGKCIFIAFILKLQDPVITEPCIFTAFGSGKHSFFILKSVYKSI
jgi:hypothetical protein